MVVPYDVPGAVPVTGELYYIQYIEPAIPPRDHKYRFCIQLFQSPDLSLGQAKRVTNWPSPISTELKNAVCFHTPNAPRLNDCMAHVVKWLMLMSQSVSAYFLDFRLELNLRRTSSRETQPENFGGRLSRCPARNFITCVRDLPPSILATHAMLRMDATAEAAKCHRPLEGSLVGRSNCLGFSKHHGPVSAHVYWAYTDLPRPNFLVKELPQLSLPSLSVLILVLSIPI